MTTYSKLLITGANGQLAHALRTHPDASLFSITACTREECDITSVASVSRAIQHYSPDIIINCAAYTAVDKAETDQHNAMMVNHLGVQNLAVACQKNKIFLLHVSTDYVFDGLKQAGYVETDQTNPINIYGESKYLGENAIREQCENHVILRVSGVVSEFGHNFVKTILRLAREKEELRIVRDQITCPTSANDIATTIYALAKNPSHTGTYHFCSTPPVSWHEFAAAIVEKARQHISLVVKIVSPISTSDYPTPAKRPPHSVLNCDKIKNDYGISQPNWHDAVKNIVTTLLKETA